MKVRVGGAAAWGLCDAKTSRSVFPGWLLRTSGDCPNNIHGSPGNGNRFFRGRHSGRKSHPPARGDERRYEATDSSGNYSFPLIDIGDYTVSGEMSGFKTETKTGIRMEL